MDFINDWRNTGQDEYLKAVKLFFKKYTTYREGWDHDHCEFCMAKFSILIPDCLNEGYATVDDYRWICNKCFEDFKEHFKWDVATQER
jgi:hypothetical protein